MPDRFADGDTSNNEPAISRGLDNRDTPRYYHGGDLQGIIDALLLWSTKWFQATARRWR